MQKILLAVITALFAITAVYEPEHTAKSIYSLGVLLGIAGQAVSE